MPSLAKSITPTVSVTATGCGDGVLDGWQKNILPAHIFLWFFSVCTLAFCPFSFLLNYFYRMRYFRRREKIGSGVTQKGKM